MENSKIRSAFLALIACLSTLNARATTFYVATNSTPVPPYSTWDTAATNIQDAVALAQSGDVVEVGDGIYTNGSAIVYDAIDRVALTNAISLISFDGPQSTEIFGRTYVGANAFVSGFSLVGNSGYPGDPIKVESGGGAWCEASGVISNCVFSGCGAVNLGAGDYGGTIYDSIFIGNRAADNGGEASADANLVNCQVISNLTFDSVVIYGGTASNCLIAHNADCVYGSILYDCTIATNQDAGGIIDCTNYGCVIAGNIGGGAFSSVLYNCILSNNVNSSTYSEGTGMGGGAWESTLYNCTVISNYASSEGGGVYRCTLYNCLVVSNSIAIAGPSGGGAFGSTLYNCTVMGNSAGLGGGGTGGGTNYNSVIYDNRLLRNGSGTNYGGGSLIDCDTIPHAVGPGNITNDPAFVNPASGNYQIQSTSPCINSGDNLYVSTTNDLAGNQRISGGTVDMGAYEYQNPSSILSYAWAQQYGLPTDGSVDYSDLDGTDMPNWEKSIAELNPTNTASLLAMSSPAATNNATGVIVTWQSVTNLYYILQRSSDLTMPFSSIQSNLVGQTGTTSFTDASATNSVPYFYRIGVQ
jgi:hypothetical protein